MRAKRSWGDLVVSVAKRSGRLALSSSWFAVPTRRRQGRIPMGLPLVAFPQAFFPLHGPLRR
jgi:hypothetical protein